MDLHDRTRQHMVDGHTVSLFAGEHAGEVRIQERLYYLRPADLPDIKSVHALLAAETPAVRRAVILMLQQFARGSRARERVAKSNT